ncbi:MAG: hypothetical protein JJ891_01845 [Rhizobiaceae bacterium]|nr:hypothetical protein [Rhizobiaceae bacterium]
MSDQLPVIGHAADVAVNLYQGLGHAGTALTEKQADLARTLGLNGLADFLHEDTEASREKNAQIDPKFDTEVGVGEALTEGLGQAAPAIGATLATGGGMLAAGAVGAGVSYVTFEDEDNLVQLTNDISGGSMPDFLIIRSEDNHETKRIKGLAGHLISEFAMIGAGKLVAKVYHAIKGGDAATIQDALEATSKEAGIPLKDIQVNPELSVRTGRERLTEFVQTTQSQRMVGKIDLEQEKFARAKTANEVSVETRNEIKSQMLPAAVDVTTPTPNKVGKRLAEEVPLSKAMVNDFASNAMRTFDETLSNAASKNSGVTPELADIRSKSRPEFVARSGEVLQALTQEQYDDALDLIKNFSPSNSSVPARYTALWQDAVAKEALKAIEDRFDNILVAIRKDPSLRTKEVWQELSGDLYDAKLKLAEFYRESGSALGSGLRNRRLDLNPGTNEKGLKEAPEVIQEELDKVLDELGYNLYSTRSEFTMAVSKKLHDMGINPLAVISGIDEMFEEFDRIRQGTIASLSDNRIAKLTKEQREVYEQSVTKMVHDLHSSALLGQPSTTGLEILSNLSNNILHPVLRVAGSNGFKDIGPNMARGLREYAGYTAGWNQSWSIFKRALVAGRSVTDDFDILDGAHAGRLDYERLAKEGKWGKYTATRLWKFAADVSIASSEQQKAMRAFGVAYADGYEMAVKAGKSLAEAKKFAQDWAAASFDDNGQLINLAVKLDIQRSSWQAPFDTRYKTGWFAQGLDNLRNSPSPLVSIPARATIPFFRTLVNIGSDAFQSIAPPASAIRAFRNVPKAGPFVTNGLKFVDDFNGTNGVQAQLRAQGRQRLGMLAFGGTIAAIQAGHIQITPPGGFERWDEKLAKWENVPGSSLIIGDTIVDLTRLLPFSAPFLLAGVVNDQTRQHAMEIKDGEYVGPPNGPEMLGIYGSSLMLMTYSLMSDASSMRGVGELFDAINGVISEGNPKGVARLSENYVKQFMPGLPKVIGKNLDGDDDMYRGEGFLEEALASAGFAVGYKRLDFLGHPLRDLYRGLDPYNSKPTKINKDPLYGEYAKLIGDAGLSMALPTPDRVFDDAFWRNLGVTKGVGLDGLFHDVLHGKPHSLTKLETKDGRDAYAVYRAMVYEGVAAQDLSKSTSSFGDRFSLGSIDIFKGENMEAALRRLTSHPDYNRMTPQGKSKVWKAVFSVYKKAAKDYVKEHVEVSPELFEGSKYGSPIDALTSIGETRKLGKASAVENQKTKGSPDRVSSNLDEIFSF